MCALPSRATSEVSGVFHTSAVAVASWPQNSAWRASCWVAGTFAKSSCAAAGVGDVQPGHHPAGRALEDLDELGLLDQLGDDLDGAGAGADDRDPLAGEVVVVVPAGAVDLVALDSVSIPRMSGQLVSGSGPEASTTVRARNRLRCPWSTRPHALVFVEVEPVDLDAELDAPAQVECVDHVLDVLADLTGRGVGPRPVRVLRERERVQQRRDVARRTGIRVVPPGAADAVGALEDDEVVDAGLGQLDRGAEAGEAGTDDQGVVDAVAVGHGQAAGSWVSSLNQVGIGLQQRLAGSGPTATPWSWPAGGRGVAG